MKPRKHIRLLCCLLWWAGVAYAQYNPSNPPEPNPYYTLTLQATPAGACTFNISTHASYAEGAAVRLKATAAANYTFVAWMEGDEVIATTAQTDYVMPARDVTLTARLTYSPSSPGEPTPPAEDTTTVSTLYLSCSPAEGGLINIASGKQYLIGATVSLKATAKTNFKFLNWTADGEVISTAAQFSYKIQRAGNNLVANFEYTPANPGEPTVTLPTYTLTLQRSPTAGGTINISSGNAYPKGEIIDLVATPKSGYNFLRWTSDGEVLSDSTAFTYVMPAHAVTLVAEFEAIYNPSNPGEPSSCLLSSGSCGDNLTWTLSCDYVLTIRGFGQMADYDISGNVVPWNEYKHAIRHVILPEQLTSVGKLAFASFARLTSVSIPEPVTHIGDSAFFRCRRLDAVFCHPLTPPVWGTDAFDEVNRLIPFVVPKMLADTYTQADGWREFHNIHEEPYSPSVVTVYGQQVVVIESSDTLTTVFEQVDVYGDATMVYTTIGNTLTLNALELNEEDSLLTAIAYTGSEPLTIVLTDSSTIVADTVISSAADIVIKGEGLLVAEGVAPIIGVPTATITFDSVSMRVRSLPSSAAVIRRIRQGKRLDEKGGPALSGFGSTDFNKTNISPPDATYGPIQIHGSTDDSPVITINALYVFNDRGEKNLLTEFELVAISDIFTALDNATSQQSDPSQHSVFESDPSQQSDLESQSLDNDQPMFNILGMRVTPAYKGLIIRQGRKYIMQ